MDPWGGTRNSDSLVHPNPLETFQDSFTDVVASKENVQQFEKLPDSEEYLNLLETKLRNLESRRARNGTHANKEQTLGALLRSESKQLLGILRDSDLDLEREVDVHPVLRQLEPRQPLTVGETVLLVESDHLDTSYSEHLHNDGENLEMSDS